MAERKNVIDQAYPGDVVGLYDRGDLKIGDTLTEGEAFTFRGIPSFAPEIFKELVSTDPMRSKQLDKGIQQLSEEGVAQLFIQERGRSKIIGAVGELQFEVIQYRLEHEYGASIDYKPLRYHKATWIHSTDEDMLNDFLQRKQNDIALDKDGNHVFLAESPFILKVCRDDFPAIEFYTTSEFKTAAPAEPRY